MLRYYWVEGHHGFPTHQLLHCQLVSFLRSPPLGSSVLEPNLPMCRRERKHVAMTTQERTFFCTASSNNTFKKEQEIVGSYISIFLPALWLLSNLFWRPNLPS